MNTDFKIQHYEHNPRQITKRQFERLKETMAEFGDLSGVVINLKEVDGQTVGELVGGNQRSEAAKFIDQKPVIEHDFDPPLEDGTVAVGYFDYDGSRFACRFVRWDDEKVMEANLIANAGGGMFDWSMIANLSTEFTGSIFDADFVANVSLGIASAKEIIAIEKSDMFQTILGADEEIPNYDQDVEVRPDNPKIYSVVIPCDKDQREGIIQKLNLIKARRNLPTLLDAIMLALEEYPND